MTKFDLIEYTGGQKTLRATDEFLLRAWEIFCEKHYRKLSASAIRALLKISNNTVIHNLSANTAFDLEMPAKSISDGAAIFPDEFQPWERYDLSIVDRSADGSFSLTFDGEVLKNKMLNEIEKHFHLESALYNIGNYLITLEI